MLECVRLLDIVRVFVCVGLCVVRFDATYSYVAAWTSNLGLPCWGRAGAPLLLPVTALRDDLQPPTLRWPATESCVTPGWIQSPQPGGHRAGSGSRGWRDRRSRRWACSKRRISECPVVPGAPPRAWGAAPTPHLLLEERDCPAEGGFAGAQPAAERSAGEPEERRPRRGTGNWGRVPGRRPRRDSRSQEPAGRSPGLPEEPALKGRGDCRHQAAQRVCGGAIWEFHAAEGVPAGDGPDASPWGEAGEEGQEGGAGGRAGDGPAQPQRTPNPGRQGRSWEDAK